MMSLHNIGNLSKQALYGITHVEVIDNMYTLGTLCDKSYHYTKQIQISDFYLSCLLSQNYFPSNLYVFPKSHMTQISITENQNQIIYCLEATLCAS